MHCRGRPRIRRVVAERSAPEGERVDESVNAPTHETPHEPAQPTVPEGGNLNAAQVVEVLAVATRAECLHRVRPQIRREVGSLSVAEYEKKFSDLIRVVPFIADNKEQKLFLDRNSRNEVGQAAPREDPVRQQRQGVSFHGLVARDRAQGHSLVKLPLRRPQVSEALETTEGASQQEGHFFRDCPNVGSNSRSENRSQVSGYTSGGRRQQRGGAQPRRPSGSSQPNGGAGRGGPPRGQPGRPHVLARVFAVTQHEAHAALEVVTGTITVFNSMLMY
ncbi:hypothetical protein JRO89_XS04G0067800 [Xanthoceras sorbifolium]|uniref:Retrotransposon gag domain-containing protein n=1 Tax=Xanthoceras sorbifolium TaxID=99658 RepID=A0ABQ8I4F4_9ROSI|nr:hypothetical protein JRO89_XS04G0067800 [Xanthoceras sorbifolium]